MQQLSSPTDISTDMFGGPTSETGNEDEVSFIPSGSLGTETPFHRPGGAVDINADVDVVTWRERMASLRLALNHPTVSSPRRNEARNVLAELDHAVRTRLPLPLFRVVVHVAGFLADESIRASERGEEDLAHTMTLLYRLTWPVLSGGDPLEERRHAVASFAI